MYLPSTNFKNSDKAYRTSINPQSQFCGASLISPRILATAIHCFYENEDSKLNFAHNCGPPHGTCYAVIREHNITKEEVGQRKINITFIHHPPSFASDLALVELEYPVKLDKHAQLVRVAEERLNVGDLVWSLGWGMLFTGVYPEVLHKVRLKVSKVDLEGNRTYTEVGKTANNIPVDPCGGDSGGPLLAKRNGELLLYATLYGAGFDCRTNGTRGDGEWNALAPHKDWIQEILKKAGS